MARQRVVFNDQLYLFGVFLQHLLEYRLKPCTIGSLVVREDDKYHRGILRPLERQAGDIKFLNKLQSEDEKGFFRAAGQSKILRL
jgi:hypothetical protein